MVRQNVETADVDHSRASSAFGGFLLTVVWSAEFVDRIIGDNVAGALLGHDANETPVTGVAAAIVFALVSGYPVAPWG